MIKMWMLGFLAGFFLGLFLGLSVGIASAQAPPVRPEQPRPDVFPCVGCQIADRDGDGDGDLQDLNPTNLKAKRTHAIAYRVELKSGCVAGTMPADLERMNTVEAPKVGLTLRRNDTTYDFKVYISCGILHVQKCGGVNVFCLPDNFPYNTDVYMSDVLSNWDLGSRIGIPNHEVICHAVATCGEQYALCGASCGFASSPNWIDFMNTGPQSRVGFTINTCERWYRIMWPIDVNACAGLPPVVQEPPPPVVVQPPSYAPECWSTNPIHYDPAWAGRWNFCGQVWVGPLGHFVNPSTSQWYYPNGAAIP